MDKHEEQSERRHVGQTGDGTPIEVANTSDDQTVYIGGIPASLADRQQQIADIHQRED